MENKAAYIVFSATEGNLLIRVLIALILGLALYKLLIRGWEQKLAGALVKASITIVLTLALTLNLTITGIVAIPYIAISLSWHRANLKWPNKVDGFAYLEIGLMGLTAILAWSVASPGFDHLWTVIGKAIFDYKFSLITLGYITMLWPASTLVKSCLHGIDRATSQNIPSDSGGPNAERGGRMIGMFERVIIITLVFLNEYAAIGFLITGKSIIRFAQQDEKIRSEYVLLGTMVSYAAAILTGAGINWLCKLS
jgi:hypothetical protein